MLITDSILPRTQRVIIVCVLVVTLCLSNIKPSEAMGLSMPHGSMVRVQPSFEHPLKEIKIEKRIPRKPDLISYKSFCKSKEEILLLIYATYPRLSSNEQVLKIVNELRGGSWVGVLGSAAFLGLIYIIVILGKTEGFVPPQPNAGWGLPKGLYEPPGLVRPNEKHNRVAVFLRSTGEFITFCEPSADELVDLIQTGNFGGQDNWFSGTPKNLPPQKEFVSDITPVNSFENDVLGITPVDPDWQI